VTLSLNEGKMAVRLTIRQFLVICLNYQEMLELPPCPFRSLNRTAFRVLQLFVMLLLLAGRDQCREGDLYSGIEWDGPTSGGCGCSQMLLGRA
jgi:hypothetical protein